MVLKDILDTNPKLYKTLKIKGEEKKYAPGESIGTQEANQNSTAFILKGVFKVTLKGENPLLLYHIDAKSQGIISFMNFYNDTIRTSVTAIKNSRLLWVPNTDILRLGNSYPLLKNTMLSSYHYNNQELLQAMDTIISSSIEKRFIDYLLKKSSIYGTNKLYIPWNEIASDLQVSKTTVFKVVKRLKTTKQITLSGGQIVLNRFSV
ncbi:Crp/Fnr family transcriptional regulator [Aquimarina hainanensis]|uniref:Crp/Fnr family transcriptional regulator n=1 Tax=Aquimarina hainanensis TaxID=1578017 RepID=A0ABW5NC88_9FLAO|nr:Crp/Fnr family transcriptional regulator [Aquimarina sp. TRL1]QKX03600.1 Crp/Fnr family transcriptional regulator [Aquimarina sp. TRL1]